MTKYCNNNNNFRLHNFHLVKKKKTVFAHNFLCIEPEFASEELQTHNSKKIISEYII